MPVPRSPENHRWKPEGNAEMDASPFFRRMVALLLLAFSSTPALAEEPAPLALRGYDTVAYFTMHKPVLGNARYSYVWDERLYQFVSRKHLAMFKLDPDRYAPRFGSVCTSALAYGLNWEADPKLWTIHENRLYVFGAAGARQDFLDDQNRVISAAGRNQERLRNGQPLVPELRLPDEVLAFFQKLYDELGPVLAHQPPK
jgi:hypothetical protein